MSDDRHRRCQTVDDMARCVKMMTDRTRAHFPLYPTQSPWDGTERAGLLTATKQRYYHCHKVSNPYPCKLMDVRRITSNDLRPPIYVRRLTLPY